MSHFTIFRFPIIALVFSFLMPPALLASEDPQYARAGEKIRQGKVKVGDEYSMKSRTGRFHEIHADKLLLDCSQCHGGQEYKADYLNVSKNKPLSKDDRGRIEKTTCLGCHQEGGMGTPFYQGSSQ